MRQYRVFYAGRPDDAVVLNAGSPDEAAYLFFANEPRTDSIFVGPGNVFREKCYSYGELSSRHPDMPGIMAALGGQTGVIEDRLKSAHGLAKAPDEEAQVADDVISKLVFRLAVAVLVVAFVAIRQCTRE